MASESSNLAKIRYRIDKFLDRYPPLQKVVYLVRGLTIDRGRRPDYLFDSIRMAFSTVFPERRFDYFVSPDGRTAGARDRDLGITLTISKGLLTDFKLYEENALIGRFPLMERVLFAAIRRIKELTHTGSSNRSAPLRVLLFALPRTGSNSLAWILHTHPELDIAFEPFNPQYSEWGKVDILSQVTDQRTLDWTLEKLFTTHTGFKHLAYQLPWHLNQQIIERPCRRIFLYRENAFEAALSNRIAFQTKDWLNNRKSLEKTPLEPIKLEELDREIRFFKKTYNSYLEFARTENLDFFEVSYETLFHGSYAEKWATLERLFDYLGVSEPNSKVRAKMDRYLAGDDRKFVRGEQVYQQVPNYSELRKSFSDRQHRSWEPQAPTRRVDSLSDLPIVKGRPLSNEFIFVLCFRNQQAKIARCLNSILEQSGEHNWGVVVVDDASTDSSLEITGSLLDKAGVPFVLVSNKERKYYSRNLYNAVNHLVTNPNSVIIEVDGDDYLAGPGVLKRLDRAYGSGAVRTMGSFTVDSSEDYFFGEPVADFSQPWDFDQCTSWMHLKTYRKWLFEKVPLPYFKERGSDRWLKMGEDMVVHPKMIELAGTGNRFIPDPLYVYDYSGHNHDCKAPDQALYKLKKLYRLPRGQYLRNLRRELNSTVREETQSPIQFAWLDE
ncbi:MAG: glycosyltransferase [Candidatus Eremiobacteraeota bacterium]|nr:glycosyltransferase [Candidatus Eremiobacteraeota bacterium]